MKLVSWNQLHEDILKCTACSLHQGIQNKVIGQGNQKARLMIVGESPGAQEDRSGVAFIGAAGELLTKMLAAIEINRNDVYICNIIKCRPPNNRTPSPSECESCLPFLRQQFVLVKPQVMLLMGSTALKSILSPDLTITKSRGNWFERKGIWMLPTYHPAALLRDPAKKREAWQDMQMLEAKLKELELPIDG